MPGDQAGNAAKRVLDRSTPPWKRWRKMSRHGRAIRFMETYCPLPKGRGHGKPIKLDLFQKEFLEEALADGIDAAILTTARGNGKSTGGGALACWGVFDDEETGAPQVPILATTVGQAIRSIYGVAVAMIEASPELRDRSLIYTGIATPRVVVPFLHGELFPVSNEFAGSQGLDYSLGLVDEIGFQPMETFTAIKGASGKRERSLLLGLGTKGVEPDNALEMILREVAERGEIPGVVVREYSTPPGYDIDDREGWEIASPALKSGFLRKSAIETDRRLMPEAHFRIFRLNQTIEGVDSWLGPNAAAIWDGLISPWSALAEAPTWIGVDIGIKRDSTAVVTVQRRPDGKLHAWCRLWIPTNDRPVDVTDVMGYLREIASFCRVEAIAYDPRFFDVPAKMLSDERLAMVEIPQSPERMMPVCGQLLQVIKGDQLRHGGDRALRAHVLNAVPRIDAAGRGFTLQKSKSRGRIDGAIALGLAVDRALHARPIRPRKPRYGVGS